MVLLHILVRRLEIVLFVGFQHLLYLTFLVPLMTCYHLFSVVCVALFVPGGGTEAKASDPGPAGLVEASAVPDKESERPHANKPPTTLIHALIFIASSVPISKSMNPSYFHQYTVLSDLSVIRAHKYYRLFQNVFICLMSLIFT